MNQVYLQKEQGRESEVETTGLIIEASQLRGKVFGSPSKSQAIRSLLFALLAKGVSTITHLPNSPDIHRTLDLIQSMGAQVKGDLGHLEVQGCGLDYKIPKGAIDVGNSGLLLRLATPLLALKKEEATITGDESIQTLRPTTPMVEALRSLGASIAGSPIDNRPPLKVQGPIRPGVVHLDGQDSQPISGLLIASSLLEGTTELHVKQPGETPWIDLTLDWLGRMGVKIEKNADYSSYSIQGNSHFSPIDYRVPADFSSLAFLIAAALITNSEIQVEGLCFEDLQGDRMVLKMFEQFGARFEQNHRRGLLKIKKIPKICGATLDINQAIDALPVFSALACYAEETTILYNGTIARLKESDRIRCMQLELTKMGAKIEEKRDGLVIHPTKLLGKKVSSHKDHRVAMSLAVAALGAKGQTNVCDVGCVSKSYPNFVKDLTSLGAHIRKVSA